MTKYLPILLGLSFFSACTKNSDGEPPTIDVVLQSSPTEHVFMGSLRFQVTAADNEVLDELEVVISDSFSTATFYVPVLNDKVSKIGKSSFTKLYTIGIVTQGKQTWWLNVTATDKAGKKTSYRNVYFINP